MKYRFTGTFDELKVKLCDFNNQGIWSELNENQKQFRHKNGGILNWFPSTGSINFQGKKEGQKVLEDIVINAFGEGTSKDRVNTSKVAESEEVEQEEKVVEKEAIPSWSGFSESELIIGLVGAVGTELKLVAGVLEERLKVSGYTVQHVHISSDIIPKIVPTPNTFSGEYERINQLMDAGNEARKKTGNNSILALGAASLISSTRTKDTEGHYNYNPCFAYIISSLKHPQEVIRLREIYPQGFYLIGVHSDEKRRHTYLTTERRIESQKVQELMARDEDEHLSYGQRVTDTFHMSDFFVRLDGDNDKLKNSIWRILDILFGNPYITPTFDEYAMFLAFAASLRSADLSRQVGAVVACKNEIIATGANDCPQYGGGLYWPELDKETGKVTDKKDGRDYMRGEDANKSEQKKIIDEIVNIAKEKGLNGELLQETLKASRIRDLTEFGRVVHAEMEALLCCARNHVSTRGADLYCTTFPCHNCAKHIVAAGINRVVYVEPYQKSKAEELHSDSIGLGFNGKNVVKFEPFVGIGPRLFFDLFSMRLGSGYELKRKDSEDQVISWKPEVGKLRMQMLPCSYIDLELNACSLYNEVCSKK